MVKSNRLKGVSITLIMGLFLCAMAARSIAEIVDSEPEGRADVIVIETLKAFGPLERGGVMFLHTRHTEALEKKGMDCTACHLKKEGRLNARFKREKEENREQVMNVYHDNCITCHETFADAGDKSGPVSCGDCHTREVKNVSNRKLIVFEKTLHYRHAKTLENKCGQCHHEYDESQKKLFYAEGREGACRYCHREVTEENRISIREAAHADCIACHIDRTARNQAAGPVDCMGCHDSEALKSLEKMADVPRMKRKQPDAVLIRANGTAVPAAADNSGAGRMNPVPFDHKAHELSNDTCMVCHHADLNACNTCHTPEGAEKGDFINLERAMHQVNTASSCVGCHAQKQKAPECAGCHSAIVRNAKQQEAYCATCHMPSAPDGGGELDPGRMDAAAATAHAQRLLAMRTPVAATYTEDLIPETVVMKKLTDQYQPARMPHRKIVMRLMSGIQADSLATAFHQDPGTLCQGCHHNSPPSSKPPLCSSCHGKPFDEKNPGKPGLAGAYHLQCMNCHEKMGIEKPDARDCNACHEKKG